MKNILTEHADRPSVKSAIQASWEAYHYCLGSSPNVELSIGRHLTWLVTALPDHFMNLVVCSQLPAEGVDQLIESTLTHFKSMNIKKFSWLKHADGLSAEASRALLAHGFTFKEAFATEMAVDLATLPADLPTRPGLSIVRVEDEGLIQDCFE